MSNSTQDGGGTSTPDQAPGKYRTRAGAANQDGTNFEIKMCALAFLRAAQPNSSFTNFTIRSNYEPAGGFDDIVLTYGSPGKEQNILVQLKHTRNSTLNLSPEGLKSYFQSLKKSETSQFHNNCSYVFFTNANMNLNPSEANVDSPAKKLLCTTWKPDNVCKVHLNDNICKEFRGETGAEDFVKMLLIFRNQSDLKYLDELIKQELIKVFNGFVSHIVQKNFVEKMTAWWSEPEKTALDKNWKEWTDLKEQILGQNTLLKQIKFCGETLSDLGEKVLDSKSSIILLKSESSEAQIACEKVYQTFIRKEYPRVLFTDVSEPQESQDMLFSLWSKDNWDVLVISDVANCCKTLGDNIANYEGNLKKKIIIVSCSNANKLGLLQLEEFGTDFMKSNFNQLDSSSKNLLQNRPVLFQGKEIVLGEIMADKILEGGHLQYVLTSPKIQIGPDLPGCDGNYIPRTLSKKPVVNKEVLTSNDVLFFAGTCEYRLKELIAKAKGENTLDEQWFRENKHRYITMTRRGLYGTICGFKCCVGKLPEDSVHFLEVIDDSFYWIHSHGSTDNLFKYIEWCPREEEDCKKLGDGKSSLAKEEDLVRTDFQTVIVADEPGSGKTALLREVASKMKELNPNRWIINIDLNKHSDILDRIQRTGNVTPENVLELLSKAANVCDSELGKQLLKYVLESGDICLLFDAFDEIAPSYTDTVLDILKLIRSNFTLSRLWIASRYNLKEKLELELKSKVFRIEPLSDKEQMYFMSMLWGNEKAVECHKTLRDELPFRVRSFPLHLKMVCDTYPGLGMSDNFPRISKSFSVINLYEQFIEKKFDIYLMEKAGLNCASAATREIKERERKHFMESHMISSLVVMDLLNDLGQSDSSSIKDEVQEICQNILKGDERFGIIDGVVNGKPHFIHRSFAEFFAGKWLSKHWIKNRWLVGRVSFNYYLKFINKVFCHELARGLPAHRAVLNGDINVLERDLYKRDVLGRTPVHLAVLNEDRRGLEMLEKLLKYRPDLEILDELSRYTPLEYALELQSWDGVRILLSHGAPLHNVHRCSVIWLYKDEFLQAVKDAGRSKDIPEDLY